MAKKPRPQASKQKQLRRQFGGAFGKAPSNLQNFLASDLDATSKMKAGWRGDRVAEDAKDNLLNLINGQE